MVRDRSLDEFVGGEAQEADSDADGERENGDQSADVDVEDGDQSDGTDAKNDDGDATESNTEDTERTVETDGVEPATATYGWDPDGIECHDCGATVDRVWSGESGAVCADCKEW